jgi:hypothetical protein
MTTRQGGNIPSQAASRLPASTPAHSKHMPCCHRRPAHSGWERAWNLRARPPMATGCAPLSLSALLARLYPSAGLPGKLADHGVAADHTRNEHGLGDGPMTILELSLTSGPSELEVGRWGFDMSNILSHADGTPRRNGGIRCYHTTRRGSIQQYPSESTCSLRPLGRNVGEHAAGVVWRGQHGGVNRVGRWGVGVAQGPTPRVFLHGEIIGWRRIRDAILRACEFGYCGRRTLDLVHNSVHRAENYVIGQWLSSRDARARAGARSPIDPNFGVQMCPVDTGIDEIIDRAFRCQNRNGVVCCVAG